MEMEGSDCLGLGAGGEESWADCARKWLSFGSDEIVLTWNVVMTARLREWAKTTALDACGG